MSALVKVTDLQIGDLVDLESDDYANTSEDVRPQFEFCEVSGFELETPECFRVDFSNFASVGFPLDHEVWVNTPA